MLRADELPPLKRIIQVCVSKRGAASWLAQGRAPFVLVPAST